MYQQPDVNIKTPEMIVKSIPGSIETCNRITAQIQKYTARIKIVSAPRPARLIDLPIVDTFFRDKLLGSSHDASFMICSGFPVE